MYLRILQRFCESYVEFGAVVNQSQDAALSNRRCPATGFRLDRQRYWSKLPKFQTINPTHSFKH
jgi:hypothetical protein